MPAQTTEQELIPGWKLKVDGTELADEIRSHVLSVEVEQHVNGSDCFDVGVSAWDVDQQDFQWLDDGTFAVGAAVEIAIGYGEDQVSLIKGEIVSLEVDYGADESPVLHVVGYDKLHRFRRGRMTKTFENVKDSEIAQRIAQSMNLQADVEDTQVVYPHVFQYNQSNIDFLQERARRIDYEVDVGGDTLRFRRSAHGASETATLGYRDDLKTLHLRLSTREQTKKVVVKGWNVASKEAIVGLGQAGDEITSMGGRSLGAVFAQRAFGDSQEVIVHEPVVSQSDADQVAKAVFNRLNLQFIQADGETVGNASLRAGEVVQLANLGARFSGPYYLCKVKHTIDDEGFRTQISCRRNAQS